MTLTNKILVFLGSLLGMAAAFAGTSTWTGGANDGKWSSPGNWDAVPASGDSVSITSGSSPLSIDLGAAAVTVGTFTVAGTGKVTITGSGSLAMTSANVTGATDLDVPVTLRDGGNTITCQGTSLRFLRPVTAIGTKNVVFSSNGNGTGHVYFEDTFTGAGTTFKMQFGNSGSSTGATIEFKKKVIAAAIRYDGGYRSCYCYLYASGNEIEAVATCYGALQFMAVDALPATTYLTWNGYYYENNEVLYAYDFHGFDQTVEAIRDTLQDTQGRDEGRILKSSDGPMTLTLKGQSDAKARCYVKGDVSLVWDPVGDFTQEFNDKASTMTGDIIVKRGTFKVSGTASFATANKIIVAGGATFNLASTANGALDKVCKVVLDTGSTFKVASTSTDAFSAHTTGAAIATGGAFDLESGSNITLAQVTYAGALLPQGVYKSAGSTVEGTPCDWIRGAGTVTVLDAEPDSRETCLWTGAGDGCSWTDDANWDPQLPHAKDIAKFAQNATLTSDVAFNQNRTIDIDSGCTVTISGCVSGAGNITRIGMGRLVLTGNNTFTGDLCISNSYVTARGENALSSSASGVITVYKRNSKTAGNLTLGNVTVKKPLLIQNMDDASNSYSNALVGEPNTVNVVESLVTIQGAYLRMEAQTNSRFIFKGGTKPATADFFNRGTGAEIIITNTPITHKIYDDGQASWLVFACASNTINQWNGDHNRGLRDSIRATVNDAFTTATYFYFGKGGVVDLCGTTQSISRIEALTVSASDWTPVASGYIRSEAPAKMTFNSNNTYTNSAIWQNEVTLEKAGSGTMYLTAASTSAGELIATEGTVELWPSARWTGDLRVNGGTIRVPSPQTVLSGCDLVLGETGTLALDAGEYTFSSIQKADGTFVAPGRYTTGTGALAGVTGEDAVVTVIPRTGPAATYVWTGAAGDGRFATLGNWDTPPDFTSMNGTYVFQLQGSTITVDTPVFAKAFICDSETAGSLTFNAATEDDVVTFSAGYLAVTSSVPVKKHVVFNGPVNFVNGLKLTVGNPAVINGDTTLQFNGDMKSLGAGDLVRIGYGGLYLRGKNYFAGDVVSSNGVTYVYGEDPLGGPGAFRQFPENTSTYLYLGGATITCDVYTYTKNDASTVKSLNDTTNRITGKVYNTNGHFRIAAGNNSIIDIAGGCNPGGFYIPSTGGNGYVMVSEVPLQSGSYYWSDSDNATRSVLNVADNYCNGTWNIYNTLETRVDHAIKNNQTITFNYWAARVNQFGCLDLLGTKQEIAKCSRGATTNVQGVLTRVSGAKVTGLPGSELKLNGAAEVQVMPVFTNAASYVNAGTATRYFRNANTSTGDLQVVSGKLVMAAPGEAYYGVAQDPAVVEGGCWIGNVTVRGGELDLNHAKAINRKMDVFVEDGGTINIPQGVTVYCAYFYVNGVRQNLKTYSGTSASGVTVDSHLTGAGRLQSIGLNPGTVLIFR